MTGAEIQALITECQAKKPETLQAYRACYGYQTGILLGTLFYAEVSGETLPFCLTQDVKDTEINTAISEFVASHDEVADLSLPATVVGAMVKAFPCKPEESE
ncbi:hypothetical protein CKO28_13815 [Rhodovibrio sodomensis]|uniref:Rap1a immunity protein domain-containing protein n=2 Tax=Rhodovibrio sodomensis TaxID=1088 RepID=A0ABS1DGM1_9PROT|nr:hypothetical protein [Rhodovibrio sodomensis]